MVDDFDKLNNNNINELNTNQSPVDVDNAAARQAPQIDHVDIQEHMTPVSPEGTDYKHHLANTHLGQEGVIYHGKEPVGGKSELTLTKVDDALLNALSPPELVKIGVSDNLALDALGDRDIAYGSGESTASVDSNTSVEGADAVQSASTNPVDVTAESVAQTGAVEEDSQAVNTASNPTAVNVTPSDTVIESDDSAAASSNAGETSPPDSETTDSDTDASSESDTTDTESTLLAPTIAIDNAQANEDNAIPLNISVSSNSINVANEAIELTLSGLPDGFSLNNGSLNADGSYSLTSSQLVDLRIIPAENADTDFSLTVTATATDSNGDTATSTDTIDVTVNAVADAPNLSVSDATGSEDAAIALNISSSLVDTDDSESLSIVISGVPDGATLSAGTDNGDGSWTLTPAQLSGLTITPTENSDTDFSLTVTATATDSNGDTATSTDTIDVTVNAVADAPSLSVADASGSEDAAIALNISSSLADTDGSESLSIVISGVPDGATLSAGTDNGDGSWTLTNEQLSGLTITPVEHSDTDFSLTVTATATDSNGDTATSTDTIDVTVNAVADAPNLSVADASGSEDAAIALNISSSLVDTDGSESLSIVISDVPDGATLSAGTDNGDGSWTLTPAQLSGLTITPAEHSDTDFSLTVTATATDSNGDTAVSTDTIDVTVNAVADAPSLSVSDASGSEDAAIALNISSSLVDTDGSESLSIVISGVPDGAELSAGTDNGDGSWTLTAGELSGLTITPAENSDTDFSLTVTATATDSNGDTATSTDTIDVTVNAVADAPNLSVSDASGSEDAAIALNISSSLVDTDGSESLSIVVSGVPDGATLSAGTDNGDGSWTLTADQLSGLTITPAENSDTDFSLTVTATATDSNGDTATSTDTIDVTVNAVADAPNLSIADASGSEDAAIALNISSSLVDTDGSESLSIVISGVPDGATLSAGTDNGDGSWTLTAGELSGLTITPAENSDTDFSLTVTSTATDSNGDTATSTDTIDVTVNAVADAPNLSVADASGSEDAAIALNISSSLVDTDGSESLSIVVSGVPSGAELSAGTDNGDGSWTLTPAQLSGLTITPAENADTDFSLTVTATATDSNGDTATSTDTIDVTVNAVADAPNLSVADASGSEDTAIALNISSSLADTDGSESLSIVISGVPDGATLSAGTDNGDGSWTLTAGELSGLTITPAENSDTDFSLTVTATATDSNGDTATSTDTIDVTVNAVADAPNLSVADASGSEDAAIALNISSSLADTDGSESLSIVISGVPDGATLSAGTDNGDGSWTLTNEQLSGLTITPVEHSDTDFSLTVTATATDSNGDTATSTDTIDVTVNAVADAPNLSVSDASGAEDAAIALNISSSLVDTDGSESLSIVISGVPNGAVLSTGIDNGDGSWVLTPAQLNGLTITPAAHNDTNFNLTVTATAIDSNGDTATSTDTIDVTINAVADAPNLSVADASGSEDTAIALNISSSLIDTDGSESLSIVISGVPDGATLSAGTDNGDGSWTLTAGELSGLTITPAENSDTDFSLTVIATATDSNGDTAVSTDTIDVTVNAVADAPNLSVSDASGSEDAAIALNISSSLVDTDGSENLSIVISGVPDGATLSAGTDNGDGSWTLTAGELSGLTITPAENSDTDFSLTVTATATDSNGDTATSTDTIDVTVNAVADAPNLSVADASGSEDAAIALNISSSLADTDGSESLSIVISGMPDGATLSAGTDNGDGSWTLTAGELSGLTITPAENSDTDFSLTVTATATDSNGDTAVSTDTIDVTVNAVADAPNLSVSDASGSEDAAIALNISSSLVDTDGSENLSIVISGVPDGATLSAGTDNGDGSWTLTAGELSGLTITPAENSDTDFSLTVTATATDSNGDTAVSTDTIDVTVNAVADAPNLSVSDASGSEDAAIALNISSSLVDTDGSENLSIVISGVPDGATLSAGTDNGDGSWTLTAGELSGLTITPAENSDTDFSLTVTATATDSNGDTATSTDTIDVTVNAVADAPNLSIADASGSEDAAIALNISSSLVDTDGSESLSIVISGVPDGATLSAGTDNGDGSWTLTPTQLSGLTITPAEHDDTDFSLTVTATSTDGSDTAATSANINITVQPVADMPILTVDDISGNEDSAIPFLISSSLVDTDGSESLSIVISGVPTGAELSAGTDNGDGSWTLTPAQLSGLTITPPENSDDNFTINVSAIATDGNDTAINTQQVNITVNPVADTPTLSVANVTGSEDTAIPLTISASLTDDSESLSIVISGVPTGAELSAGTDNGDSSWTLTPAQLSGLTITPAENSDTDFNLTVTATSTDGSDTASTSETLSVTVNAVADAPTLTVSDASGDEDTAIALSIDSNLVDTDGSESLSIVISGVPDGSELSAGQDNGDGSWTLTPNQLSGLTITPPQDYDEDFSLTVTATSTDTGGDTASTSATIDVTVNPINDFVFSVNDVTGSEDTDISLNINVELENPSETAYIYIYTIPNDYVISGVEPDAVYNFYGGKVYQFDSDKFDELQNLTITPPEHSDADLSNINVLLSRPSVPGGNMSDSFDLIVTPVADTPNLTVTNASGGEDAAIALNISSSLVDTDGSESLSILIEGVPDGAELSAGTDNGDGSWTLTPAQLSGLTITPAENSDTDFDLTVTATSTDGSDTASTSETLSVTVNAVADTPNLTVANVSGNEDEAIALNISSSLTDTDGSESLSIVISDVPDGAELSAGTDNGDGSWTLTPAQLSGLTITPAENSDTDFDLTVTATSTDGSDTASTSETLSVTVNAVADTPNLTVANVSGNEDEAIALNISSSLVDTDGSESLSIVISGVPTGAELSAGQDNGDGSWTLTPAQLSGLTITPAEHTDTDFDLTVTATSTDGSDTASTSETLSVTVNAIADAPILTASNVSGTVGDAIDLDINSQLVDVDGSESLSIVISGVPSGATLSAGTNNGDGSWTLTPAQLSGLQINTSSTTGTYTLTAVATTTESIGGDTESTTINFTVTSAPLDEANAPNLYAWDVSGSTDHAILLPIHASLNDQDGSETLTVIISGIPQGATLTAGTDNGDGSWTLTQDQIEGIALNPPDGADPNTYDLTVTAVSTNDSGDTETLTDNITVTTLDTNEGSNSGQTTHLSNSDDGYHGQGGNDKIYGKDGDDALYGGSGSDRLYGDDGDDSLFGGTGNDRLYGRDDNDVLFGEEGDDRLYGGDNNDVLFGGEGDDKLYGDDGDDYLFGGAGKDKLYGGEGDDYLFASENEDTNLNSSSTFETLWGEEGSDTFVFDTLYDQPGGYKVYGNFSGGSSVSGAGAWTDVIQLDVANEAPSEQLSGEGSWVLETDSSYTIDAENQTITFDDSDASGTITLSDGSEIQFQDIDEIKWG